MSEQKSPAEPDAAGPEVKPAQAAPRPVHHNPLASLIARMSIAQMTLAVVLAVFLWQWYDMHRQLGNMQQELARRLTEMEGNNKADQLLVSQGQEATRELSAKVALLEGRFADSQNQRAALESLYQELSGSRDETTLAQVEQMLMIAGQQLQLSSNVKAALIAMQQADDYLKRMDRGSLNGVRKAIARDMDKLRALPDADVSGINRHLDDLIEAADKLPLAQDIRMQKEGGAAAPLPAMAAGWQGLVREMWDDAKRLVRIENLQKQELPLLSPTQSFFLRENLKLRLLSARLALLTRDEASYKYDLQTAQEWVRRYFDAKSADAVRVDAALQKLRAAGISIEIPDIGDSLEAVRNYRVMREKQGR